MSETNSSNSNKELQLAQEKYKFMVAQNTANAVICIINTVDIIVKGATYRANLSAIVKSLQADHTMRHDDVDKLIEVLDTFGSDMSQDVRDEYYLAVLELLKASGRPAKLELPPPPS